MRRCIYNRETDMTLNNMEMLEKANTSPGLFLKDNNPHKY